MTFRRSARPFLASFSRPVISAAEGIQKVPVAYDLGLDLCVISQRLEPLTDNPSLLKSTGSHFTEADQDPTRDEPADR